MIHYMHLQDSPFQKISLGEKTIELRLFDEKRKLITTGDLIVFSNLSNPDRTITAEVKGLYVFSSFEELYASLPLDRCGYSPDEVKTASPKDMEHYYSAEEQKLHGVVVIDINVVSQT